MNDISFTAHALGQFSKRVCVPITESAQKIRIVWNYAQKTTRERAYEVIGDKEILKKGNKNAEYYEVQLGLEEIKAVMGENNHTPFDQMIGIFVIKDNKCITFKTNIESIIYSQLYAFKYTKRCYDVEGAAYK